MTIPLVRTCNFSSDKHLKIIILEIDTKSTEINRKLTVVSLNTVESDQSNTDTFVKLLRSSTSGPSSEGGFLNDAEILSAKSFIVLTSFWNPFLVKVEISLWKNKSSFCCLSWKIRNNSSIVRSWTWFIYSRCLWQDSSALCKRKWTLWSCSMVLAWSLAIWITRRNSKSKRRKRKSGTKITPIPSFKEKTFLEFKYCKIEKFRKSTEMAQAGFPNDALTWYNFERLSFE